MKHTVLLFIITFFSMNLLKAQSSQSFYDRAVSNVQTHTETHTETHVHDHKHSDCTSSCSSSKSCSSFSSHSHGETEEYRMKHSGGKLIIDLGEVSIEGYDGTEIIFTAYDVKQEDSERAKGLKRINGSGLTDNSNIGLSVVKDGANVVVKEVSSNCYDLGRFSIKVPKNMKIYVSHKSTYGESIELSNINNEIEVSCNYNDVFLNNVTGPMAVKSVYGDVEADFSTVKGSSISLHSVYGHVDVTIPKSTKANLTMKASYGEIYSDLDIKIDSNNNSSSYSSSKIIGSINGGGLEFSITASYEDIYLRGK